jgi:hypothetical protein
MVAAAYGAAQTNPNASGFLSNGREVRSGTGEGIGRVLCEIFQGE